MVVRRPPRPEAVATLPVYDAVNVLEPATAIDTEFLPPPADTGTCTLPGRGGCVTAAGFRLI